MAQWQYQVQGPSRRIPGPNTYPYPYTHPQDQYQPVFPVPSYPPVYHHIPDGGPGHSGGSSRYQIAYPPSHSWHQAQGSHGTAEQTNVAGPHSTSSVVESQYFPRIPNGHKTRTYDTSSSPIGLLPHTGGQNERRHSKGRDYLHSLSKSLSNLNIVLKPPRSPSSSPTPKQSPSLDKPLPEVPAADISSLPQGSSPLRKSFRPSFHPLASSSAGYGLNIPPLLTRPHSDPTSIPSRRVPQEIIDLTIGEDESASYSTPVTPTRKRYTSLQTPVTGGTAKTNAHTPLPLPSPTSSPSKALTPSSRIGSSTSTSARCAGFTRAGTPCKRLVKSAAPYLLSRDPNRGERGADVDVVEDGRYCKDHAGMICQAEGFYSRGRGGANARHGLWINFADYIPNDLGQQTQALLRTTMESRLSDKDLPGFLYVYELRDLQTDTASYFKVGRTDNVPRRISQWTSQCQSHTPILRNIFPAREPGTDLARRGTGSFLPGAFHSGSKTDLTRPRIDAMKRWERLVHLQLSDISSRDCGTQWEDIRQKCGDCGSVHREIFVLPRTTTGGGGGGEYERVVEVIERWAGFVQRVCGQAQVQ